MIKRSALGVYLGEEVYNRYLSADYDDSEAQEARFTGTRGIANSIGVGIANAIPKAGVWAMNKQTNTVDNFYGKATIEKYKNLPYEKIGDKLAFGIGKNEGLASKQSFEANLRGEVEDKLDKYYLGNDKLKDRSWRKDYKTYISNVAKENKSGFTVTPEEFRHYIASNDARQLQDTIDKRTQEVYNEIAISKNKNPERVPYLEAELDKLDKESSKLGKASRYYRSEIAKNEIENGFLADKRYSTKRLKQAGYSPVITARWNDLEAKLPGLPEGFLKPWKGDVDIVTPKIQLEKKSKLGKKLSLDKDIVFHKGGKIIREGIDKQVVVFKNTHRGDAMLFNKTNKNFHNIAAKLSHGLGTGEVNNIRSMNAFLRQMVGRSDIDEFKLGRRQYAALGGKKYGKYLNDGKNRQYILKNNEFRKFNRFAVDNIANEIKPQVFLKQGEKKGKILWGGVRKKWDGSFKLKNLGGVTAQYFEGGVNMMGEYRFDSKNNKVYSRRIKTDVHDIFKSSKVQNNVPLLIDEFYHQHYINNKGIWTNTSQASQPSKSFEWQSRLPNRARGSSLEDINVFERGGRKKMLVNYIKNNPSKASKEIIKLFASKSTAGKVFKLAGLAMDATSLAYIAKEMSGALTPYLFNMSDDDDDMPSKN